jgi:hypothetical protein
MLVVRSTIDGGFRQDGSALLRVGENRLDEATLSPSEEEFIRVLCAEGVAEIVVDRSAVEVLPDHVQPIVEVPAESSPAVADATAPRQTRRRRP